MSNNEIVAKLAKDRFVEEIIEHVTDHGKKAKDVDSLTDLAQDLYLSILTDKKIPEIYDEGHINFYVTRMVCNNIMSSSSPYYRIYLKPRVIGYTLNEKYRDKIDYGDEGNGKS